MQRPPSKKGHSISTGKDDIKLRVRKQLGKWVS